MTIVKFSLFPQNVYRSSSSLIQRGLDCLEFLNFCPLILQLLSAAVVMGFSSPSLSETSFFLLRPLLVTTVTATSTVDEERGLQLELVQVTVHLMTVKCLLFPWKLLPVLVLNLDFAVF